MFEFVQACLFGLIGQQIIARVFNAVGVMLKGKAFKVIIESE
jgi:hypothetical protein